MYNNISSFSSEVQLKIGYYVYRLIDPRNGTTFYIGKGKGDRVFQHVKGELKSIEKQDEDYDSADDEVSLKIRTIHEIYSAGLEVIHVIHRHGITDEATAFEVEAALIDATPGLEQQGGHGSCDYGPMNAMQIEKMYSAIVLGESDINAMDQCLIIKTSEHWVTTCGSLYEAVRSAWKVGKRREKVKHVLAVVNQIVEEVYCVEKWSQNPEIQPRWEFTGKVADSIIRERYISKKIPEKYRLKGQASPFFYTF